MTNSRLQIEEAVNALELSSDGILTWRHRQIGGLNGGLRTLPAEERRKYLREQITDCLYSRFYIHGGRVEPVASAERSRRITPEIERLAQIYRQKYSWTGGWELLAEQGERLKVRQNGIVIWASSSDVSKGARDGQTKVRLPAVGERLSPGFLLIRGAQDLDLTCKGRVLRLYWNLQPNGAQPLFETLTTHCDDAAIPYRLKVLRALYPHQRCDAAVLYLPADCWQVARTFLEATHAEIAGWLGARTPAFTLPLAAGIALAEDPISGESFGRSRSQLLADSVLDAWENDVVQTDRRFAAILEGIKSRGFDPDNLHLDAGSHAQYQFVPQPKRPQRNTGAEIGRTIPSSPANDIDGGNDDVDCLAVAVGLADDLVERSWWEKPHCTWVGATPVSTDDGRRRGPETWSSLRPEVYGGLAGVAFYLAELNAIAPDPNLERTSRCALATALALDEEAGESAAPGLYSGRMGIAVVQARSALLASDRKGIRMALERGERAAASVENRNSFDVIAGKSGAILGLLILAEISGETRLLKLAVSLGDQLARAAVRRGGGRAWGPKEGAWPLTGYAHGASGIAHALTELYSRTGLRRFEDVARDAVRYEHMAFDPVSGNWPDFRIEPGDPVLPRGQYPTGSMWCHGATGVLIGMRRVCTILDLETADLDLDRARGAVRHQVRSETAGSANSWCLCHGVCGDALALVHGGSLTPVEKQDRTAVFELARVGAERYLKSKNWPCGVGGGWSPSYMVGTAGTGAFYLGITEPRTPSFLIPIPEAFAAR